MRVWQTVARVLCEAEMTELLTVPAAFKTIQDFDSSVRQWKGIVIHHSATKDGVASDWEAIRKWHTGQTGSDNPASRDFNKYILKPMQDIGYEFGLEKVNGRLEYKVGRPLTMDGGHTIGMNKTCVGICVIGNFDLMEPSIQHYFMTACICRELMNKFGITTHSIHGHREFAQKTCPGKLFNMDILKGFIEGVIIV